MWIGSIRLIVTTKNVHYAGTDDLITATIMKDGVSRSVIGFDLSGDDLEQGDARNYDKYFLPQTFDQTRPLPPGIGQDPMPYPPYGIEFSNGLTGHLSIRLRTDGSDMWIVDTVEVYVREIRNVATSFDTIEWRENNFWNSVKTFTKDVRMSEDRSEGVLTYLMNC